MPRNRVSASGTYNVICDRCGFKFKNTQLRKEWTGAMVCNDCWEPRHSQDFVRAARKEFILPFARPDTDQDLTYSPTWTLFSGGGGDQFWETGFWETGFWANGFWEDSGGGDAGNSTIIGQYTVYTDADGNKVVNVRVYATLGSTVDPGNGVWTISVPITNGSQAATGEATMLVGGTKAIFGNVTLPASSSTATIRSKETGEQWAHNVPAVWGENDILTMSIRYSTEI